MIAVSATKEVLSERKYVMTLVVTTATLLFLFVLIPVLTIQGNDFSFQLTVFTLADYFTMVILAALSSLFIVLHAYGTKRRTPKGYAKSGAGALGATFAAVVGTATCASCLVPLFGAFGVGLGGVVFFLQYKTYVVALTVSILLVSIHLTSKKIVGACKTCKL